MPVYTISLTEIEEKALVWKTEKTEKTKGELFDDLVKGTIIAAWIREMKDEENKLITQKYEDATEADKLKVKAILEKEKVK